MIPIATQNETNLGPYRVVGAPRPGCMQMLRYKIFRGKRLIGVVASLPDEKKCRDLESPPVVPAMKEFRWTGPVGRPRKNAAPRTAIEEEFVA